MYMYIYISTTKLPDRAYPAYQPAGARHARAPWAASTERDRAASIDFGASTGPARASSIDLGVSTYPERPTSIDFGSILRFRLPTEVSARWLPACERVHCWQPAGNEVPSIWLVRPSMAIVDAAKRLAYRRACIAESSTMCLHRLGHASSLVS